jgi:hypothetical protein
MNDAQTRYTLELNTVATVQIQTVQYEFIRIQILDCRSGAPIPNCRVKKLIIRHGGTEVVTEFAMDKIKIDTSKPIYASQVALYRLGFITDVKNVTNAYSGDSITAFNNYWANRASGEVPTASSKNLPVEAHYSLITKEYNSHYETDSSGILTVRIPQNFFNGQRVEVEVGLFDCPIILEELRNDSRNSSAHPPVGRDFLRLWEAPNFKIVWNNGTQNTAWGGLWGWEARKMIPSNTRPRTTYMGTNTRTTQPYAAQPATVECITEFKVSELLVIKNNSNSFTNNSVLDTSNMSVNFLSTVADSPHFVLFAMQWCQPVWDGIDDPQGTQNGIINEDSYIQNTDYSGLNMHIVTLVNDGLGSEKYGGKGYGKCEVNAIGHTLWRGNTGHAGIDLYARDTDNIYALHSGTLTQSLSHDGGNTLKLAWNGSQAGYLSHLHLTSYSRTNNEYVMAGTIIAIAGRTGNLGLLSEWPGHVHLNIQARSPHEVGLRTTVQNYGVGQSNLNCIPFNDYPLVFPCKCQVTSVNLNPTNCRFDDTTYASACWAVAELKCPYMTGNTKRDRRLQAQLRFLNYYSGNIDGVFGIIPANSKSHVSNTRQAIYNFKQHNNLTVNTFSANNYDLTATDITLLDNQAPITLIS